MKTDYVNTLCILLIALYGSVAAQAQTTGGNGSSAAAESSAFEHHAARRAGPTWRFDFANDVIFDSDNQFTNGWRLGKHSAAADDLDSLEDVWKFGQWFAKKLLPESDGLKYRNAFTAGQNMATPEELENPDIILDDTPYSGLLAVEGSWIAFDDKRFTGIGVTAGLVGKWSLAEYTQKAVHSLIDATDPEGWDHQLDHEPILNFYFMKKYKLWNTPAFDGAFNLDVSVGNYHTGLDVGLEMQIGRKPVGFTYLPDPIGRNMTYDASLGREDGRMEIYGTIQARAWAWAVFMPMEGNILVSGNEWTDHNTIDPEHVIGQAIIGFHVVKPRWGLHFSWTFSTDNVDEDTVSHDVENEFGMITFEYRFK
jgi:hypothetical protein